ncbi:MAG: phosphoribosylformylglycinamidine cyclo-ligase [Thermoplasmata archaeon]|nr:phosphoribosylformylglycinamidine cyclo-ligase [Thermoplasmata archaeon]
MDRGTVTAALSSLLARVSYVAPPASGRPVEGPGHYAGLVRIGRETIAITTDTVGTKSLLAARLGRWEEVGEDIVGVNVNDLAAVGARPSALVDCILCASPDPKIFAQIGIGIDRGLRASRCSLVGGETAVVPDVVNGYDLGGTAIGFCPRGRRPITGREIRPGDLLIGVPSAGFHANGFTLVRRLIDEHSIDLAAPRSGGSVPLGVELLRPTRIYVGVSETMAASSATHGLAHISGGGVRNLVRLNRRVAFVLDEWPEPSGLFQWVAELGGIENDELYQTFNVGVGFVVIVPPVGLSATMRRLARAGAADARVVGHVERGAGVRLPHLGIRYAGYS